MDFRIQVTEYPQRPSGCWFAKELDDHQFRCILLGEKCQVKNDDSRKFRGNRCDCLNVRVS